LDQGSGSANTEVLDSLRDIGVQILLHQAHLPEGAFDVVVVSPGIPQDHAWVRSARSVCRDVISELELGYRYCECPILAVTGTNGKSTLVHLLDHMLRYSGARSKSGGNIGVPLCELVSASRYLDWLVIEVSSFQLETVRHFRPHGAVLLNIQPDHLDRHGTMASYLAVKCRLFAQMGPGTVAVIANELMPAVQAVLRERIVCEPVWISFGGAMPRWHYDDSLHAVSGRLPKEEGPVHLSVRDTYFDHPITGQTAAAAVALLSACLSCTPALWEASLQAFEPLPHRCTCVGHIGGVRFVNDSKATNIAAMCAGIMMQKGPVHLIAGGVLKEKDVFVANQVLKKHVSCVYLIGEAAITLEQAWKDVVPTRLCETLENAIRNVCMYAQAGDVVLLSPGCASFDQFRSYAERGERFADLIVARKKKE